MVGMPFVQLLKYQKALVFNHSIFDHVRFGSSQTGQYIHTHFIHRIKTFIHMTNDQINSAAWQP